MVGNAKLPWHHSEVGNSQLASRLLLASKENVNLFSHGHRAFEIGEMSAIFQRYHAGIWNCLSNVLSRSGRDEFVVASVDQSRNFETLGTSRIL